MRVKRFSSLAITLLAITAGIAGAAFTQERKPATFKVTAAQASEIAAITGFLRAYNSRNLSAALRYFYFPKKLGQFEGDGATDCDYRRQTTKVYEHRPGVVRWLKQRFADHDRLTLAWIADQNPAQPIGVVGVKYARRVSDTLRKLGFRKGIVPQIVQKLPFYFEDGEAKFSFFLLASKRAPTPNPDCALVPSRG